MYDVIHVAKYIADVVFVKETIHNMATKNWQWHSQIIQSKFTLWKDTGVSERVTRISYIMFKYGNWPMKYVFQINIKPSI